MPSVLRLWFWISPDQVALVVKDLPASKGDARGMGLIPGSGRSPGEGNGNPLQYSCLENFVDRGAWWVTVNGVSKSQTQLSTHAYTLLTALHTVFWLALDPSCSQPDIFHLWPHFTFFPLLECNCFTVLSWFLLYSLYLLYLCILLALLASCHLAEISHSSLASKWVKVSKLCLSLSDPREL